jgi:hypothetical protein
VTPVSFPCKLSAHVVMWVVVVWWWWGWGLRWEWGSGWGVVGCQSDAGPRRWHLPKG